VLTALPAEAREGFGLLTKKAASLNRVSPPAVFLMRTKIHVKTSSSKPESNGVAQRLQSQLESALISRDSRLSADPDHPETLIEVTVLQNDASERWDRRREMETRQVGKDSKGKPVFESYPVEVNYKVISHNFAASYKVTDLSKAASLDADSIHSSFSKDFREGRDAPEVFSLEGAAIDRVVDGIARRLTPTRETINVLVPKGSLESLGGLAEAGQWNRYLEALEKQTPNTKVTEESYHQYALGTAYEALGYAADDPEVTLKYLQQASIYYGKAIEFNPGEKYFSQPYNSIWSGKTIPPPLDRVQSALVNYRRLKDFRDNYGSLQAAKVAEDSKSLEERSGERMDNAAVIRMVKAGLEKDVILNAIESAPRRAFDTSPKGLIDLADAKVDKKLILRMQEIARGKKNESVNPSSGKKPALVAKKKTSQGR
jgi:hypothetical protein